VTMAPAGKSDPAAGGDDGNTEKTLTVGDIGRRAASGAALLTAKGVFQQILGFASTIVVTRLLLPEQLGLFAIALTISTFLWMLGGGQGMAGALIRRPTPPEHADLQAYVALQMLIMTALAVVVALVTVPFGLLGKVTLVMVAAGPVVAFRGAGAVVLERQLLYQRLATAETVELFAYYIWMVTAVAIGWGVWGLATATVVRSVVGTIAVIRLAPTGIVWPRFDRRRARALLGIGVRVQAVELIAALRDQLVLLGTAAFGSVTIVGYWSVVIRLLQAPGMVLFSLVRVAFPAMSRAQTSGQDPAEMLPRLVPVTTIVSGVLVAPLAAGAPAFVPLLLGDQWLPAAHVLPLACFALVMHTPLLIAGQSYLWAVGDAKSPLNGIVADAIVIVAVGLPLVPSMGVLGLAIGLAASAIVHAAILARAVDKRAHVGVLKLIRLPVALWVVAAGVGWAYAESGGPLIVRAVFSALIALGLYIGLLLLTRRELLREMAGETRIWVRRYRRRAVPLPAGTN
jgi:O-antigen/teichoic acid export membrane protein